MLIGAGVATIANYIVQSERAIHDPKTKFDVVENLTCAAIGAGVACLPDLLEPATSPNHRATCHSLLTFALLGGMVDKLRAEGQGSSPFVTLVLLPYLSHLGADALTPKCLPIC